MNSPPRMPHAAGTTPEIARLRDELAQQSAQLDQEQWIRLGATMLAFAMGLIYLPIWVILPLAAANLAADLVSGRIMRDFDRMATSARRQAVGIVTIAMMEITFVLPAALMWHLEDTFAKCLAIGMAASAMMHLATVRAIHLPQGLWGGGALSLVVITSNTAYWALRGEWTELAVSSVCAATGFGYFIMAMISNNRVHRQSATDHRRAQQEAAAKDRLLATISHELRTPLNGILGMGHTELANATSPEARERLAVLVASAEGMSVILDDILDISAARDGRLAIRPAVAVPADEIAATILLFRHSLAGNTAPVAMDIDPELAKPAIFDRQRTRQCLSNLVSNAMRHGQGATVRVRAVRSMGANGRAMLDLTVADDGPGVPQAIRDILFEPFARLHGPAPTGVRQGQGLGLAISRSLARLMGGDVTLVSSDPGGGGTVFRLTLELAPAPLVVDAPPAPIPQQRPFRVLVVDDIATNRLVGISCLRLVGADGTAVDSGEAALDQIAGGGFDVVFLDMNMPGLDGLATLAAIRAMAGDGARIRVVAMTADAGEDKRAQYLAAGCDGYLAKPVTPDSIAAALASLPPAQAGTV